MQTVNRDKFVLPKGYSVWCWICAEEPFNKKTNIDGKDIPGMGFKTIDEHTQHVKDLHRVWKG